jgi:hypothetical protein
MAETYDGTEGDDALAGGLPVMDGNEDWRDGWKGINLTRDLIAQLRTWVTGQLGTAWGSITGTLSAQTDLQAALDAKLTRTGAQYTADFAARDTDIAGKVSKAGDTITGSLGVTGNIENSGILRSSGVRSTAVSSWINVGVDPSGYLGNTSSSRSLKTDIADFADPGDFDAIKVRQFEWIQFPGSIDHGVIAEEMEDAGFDWLVVDVDGTHKGVRYELMALALIPIVQELRQQVAALAAQVTELRGAE